MVLFSISMPTVADKPIVREVSQDWHTNISAEDGTIVEIEVLGGTGRAQCISRQGGLAP